MEVCTRTCTLNVVPDYVFPTLSAPGLYRKRNFSNPEEMIWPPPYPVGVPSPASAGDLIPNRNLVLPLNQ